MPTFFIKKRSGWQFSESSGDDLKFGEVFVGGGNKSQLRVVAPNRRAYILDYFGAGVGVGLTIKIPMKIAGSTLLGISVKGFQKSERKIVNKAVEYMEDFDKGFSGGMMAKSVLGTESDDAVFEKDLTDQIIPDELHPSAGTIFVGAGCKTDDLQPDDFNGSCFYCDVDARFIFGCNGTAMFVGLHPVQRSRLERLMMSFDPTGIGPAIDFFEMLADAKAALMFGGASWDAGAGSAGTVNLGRMRCRPEQRAVPAHALPP